MKRHTFAADTRPAAVRRRLRTRRTALAGILVAAVGLAVAAPGASAAVTCSKWAATAGSDANAGSQGAPYRSLDKLVGALQGGQAGCLAANQTYYATGGNGVIGAGGTGTAAAPVVITSGPGGRAIVKGQLWLTPASHDIELRELNFRGGYTETGAPLYTKGSHLILHGDRIGVVDNDISDPRGICIGAGRAHATNPDVNDVASDMRVLRNRIHDCGMAADIVWAPGDSGSHGVYLENTLNARIADNLIYHNRWRGLQLWPRNNGAVIERNLFDDNATHVNIGSSLGTYGGTFKAENTVVRDNIFSGRVKTFQTGQNPSQLYGYFPAGSPTYGNTVASNCFAPGDPAATGNGYALGVNTTAQATFVDRGAGDYRLSSGACAGDGPSSIQPVANADRYVTVTAPANGQTGAEVTDTIRVVNRTATATPITVNVTITAAKLLALAPSSGTCGGLTCSATLPASGTVTISARLGATAAGTATTRAALSVADTTPADDSATAGTSLTGAACTYAGTDAADTIQGGAGNEVFCTFGGNDTVMPSAGNDVVVGGSGTDRVSYWNAASAVTINLGQAAAWDSGAATAIGWDTFRAVEWGTGTAYADVLVGGPAADILDGLESDDELWGYAGNDVLKGWSGKDRLYGGDGDDSLDGGDGTDLCDQGFGTGARLSCES